MKMMEVGEGEGEESLLPAQTETVVAQRKKKDKNSRRFSDEQISSLESMFKLETKLEPRKKLQLARELGLQPRQVAIWFQNRRARWKSKQIEQEYRLLKSNFDNLSSRFDTLSKEKQSLLIQLEKLRDQLDNKGRESKDIELEGNSTDDSGSDNGKKFSKLKENTSCLRETLGRDVVLYSDDEDNLRNRRYPAQGQGQEEEEEEEEEEAELKKLGEQVDVSSLVPPERWCNFETGGLFDHTCSGTLNWWDFST